MKERALRSTLAPLCGLPELAGNFEAFPVGALVIDVDASKPAMAFNEVAAWPPAVVAFKPIPRLNSSASD